MLRNFNVELKLVRGYFMMEIGKIVREEEKN